MDNVPSIPVVKNNKKQIIKIARVALPVIGLAIAAYLILVYLGILKPSGNIPSIQRGPSVNLKTEYKNPFDKETQFVNPFDKYKNPFVVGS